LLIATLLPLRMAPAPKKKKKKKNLANANYGIGSPGHEGLPVLPTLSRMWFCLLAYIVQVKTLAELLLCAHDH